jgi:two-component system, NarL family, nitrate/nitrite response regulator NarL
LLDVVTHQKTIGVLVVAATRLYREGLVERLETVPGLRVAGSAAGRDEAVGLIRELRPDIVLLDMSLAQDVQTLRVLVDCEPRVRVVAFGVAESEDVVIACAEAGVSGYVGRDASLDQLVSILEGAAREEVVCSPKVAATLLRRVGALARERGTGAAAPEQRLTSRETQVVALIDEGLSNKEIAARLNIELATVKNHVHNIIEKLQVSGRGEAAARVRALGY